jgi:hypothetical protein
VIKEIYQGGGSEGPVRFVKARAKAVWPGASIIVHHNVFDMMYL